MMLSYKQTVVIGLVAISLIYIAVARYLSAKAARDAAAALLVLESAKR